MSKKFTLTLGANTMEITPQPIASFPTELINKKEIVAVYPVFNKKPVSVDEAKWWIYPYNNMTVIDIQLSNGNKLNIELQDITNQPTWNLGTLAALNAAVTAIKAWM